MYQCRMGVLMAPMIRSVIMERARDHSAAAAGSDLLGIPYFNNCEQLELRYRPASSNSCMAGRERAAGGQAGRRGAV